MGQTEATRQADWILPPMASSTGKVPMYVAATSASVASVDLTTIPGMPDSFAGSSPAIRPNVLGGYITVQAEGADIYFVFGKTQPSVTGANAPVQSAAGTNVVGLAGYCPAGQERNYKLPAGDYANAGFGNDSPARWFAVVTKSGTGVVRIFQSCMP